MLAEKKNNTIKVESTPSSYRKDKTDPGQGCDKVQQDLHGKSPEEDATPEISMKPTEGTKQDAENDAGALNEGVVG